MVKVQEAILVEGRYDKNTLSQVVDAYILETSGFGIFHDKKQLAFLRKVAEKRGLIVFTDSDGAGFVIRNFLKGTIPKEHIKHAYIPDVYGKERRKTVPGKEGKLGVEGMTPQVILQCLQRAGATFCEEEKCTVLSGITKTDFCQLGLSGGKDSSILRRKLANRLQLPEHMSANAMLEAVNLLCTPEELSQIVKQLAE